MTATPYAHLTVRERLVHRCTRCGAVHLRWAGRCSSCGEWNTLVEAHERPRSGSPAAEGARRGQGTRRGAGGGWPAVDAAVGPVALQELPEDSGRPRRTGIDGLDLALSGGLVAGSVTLVGGEPGVGKSTLLLQVAASWARRGGRSLYVCAEESAEQLRRRAGRLSAAVEGVQVVATTSLPRALEVAEQVAPDLLVVDSVQAVADPELSQAAGSVAQVRECAAQLVAYAKRAQVATVLAGHVTKDGVIAGPKVLEHLVDTVCSLEGDRHHGVRVLSVAKHRFGPSGELALFEMTARGLAGVADPSSLLLADRRAGVAGSVVVPVVEGRRALLVELQALVAASPLANPRRGAQGVPPGRLAMVLAVLEQRLGLVLAGRDVFVSVVGGVKVAEPAVDLALGLAVSSAATGTPLPADLVACGEVGLGGEVRQVAHTDRRLAEAARLGFAWAVVPPSAPDAPPPLSLLRAPTLAEAALGLGLGTMRQ